MKELISPKYQMKLVEDVESALRNMFKSSKNYNIEKYLEKWQVFEDRYTDTGYHIGWTPQFEVFKKKGLIDLKSTLHFIDVETLLKIVIDLGVETPDFLPSIPTFKNVIKEEYENVYDTFIKALKFVENEPDIAIGIANSAFESLIKKILKDERISSKLKGGETLLKLTKIILKEFNISNDSFPNEVKTISTSLLSISQSIEKLRSEKTNFHGKTKEDIVINDSIYVYLIVNSITSIGLFLNSYFEKKFPKPIKEVINPFSDEDDLPF